MAEHTLHPIETDFRIALQDPEVLDAPHVRRAAIRSIGLAGRRAAFAVESVQRYAGLTQIQKRLSCLSRNGQPDPSHLN
jgi:hypothetical protein